MDDKYYRVVEGMLYSYKKLVIKIKNIDIDIEELKNSYEGCTGINYGERSSPTNKFSSTVENELVNKDYELEKLQNIKKNYERKISKIDNILSILTNDEYRLIELRYFQRLRFKEISEVLNKSDIYLIGLRKKIIKDKLIPLIKDK
ncbi:RNA polymerase subunit sigma [Clostridium tyrobutyricum]|uniref:RNA polymerase subunit sigma n=1 Tax=Clostridium tyrobutyricum TaxID=1519 RepID=UPI001C380448|nr:RNA polymerase subunit sigma [Clostridium tyrobutyricum]MBV4427136.1 RNA polymerase subunit sigma [Clostridium tyrobutyricum]MBV4442137.1 RNA polymerase subunit sigma [Clostridium tyrobutyricum]MBV4442292.1 RNA polymerase subunit sigma [Clostridium tyrobutyricum]